jgi:hypothetical protein
LKKRSAEFDTGLEPTAKKKSSSLVETKGKAWLPIDDFLLLRGIQAGTSLRELGRYGPWSANRTPIELYERWAQALYDEQTSAKMAQAFITHNKTLRRSELTPAEAKVLERVKNPDFPGLEAFFDQNRNVWHPSRTVADIELHSQSILRGAASSAHRPHETRKAKPKQSEDGKRGTPLNSKKSTPNGSSRREKPENCEADAMEETIRTPKAMSPPREVERRSKRSNPSPDPNDQMSMPSDSHRMEEVLLSPQVDSTQWAVEKPKSASKRATPHSKGTSATPEVFSIEEVVTKASAGFAPHEEEGVHAGLEMASMTPEERITQYRWADHPGVFAVIYGQKIFYEVREVPIIIGRKATAATAPEQNLHINLSEEGEASKISRSQAIIDKMGGNFTLKQLGKATTLVDGVNAKSTEPIPIPEHATLTFSALQLEWIANPAPETFTGLS